MPVPAIDPSVGRRFCRACASALLLPAEMFGPSGAYADQLPRWGADTVLTQEEARCLSAGFALYWQRAADLSERAPRHWLPPRALNVLLALDAQAVPPYLAVFPGASALLYRSDLQTHPEFVAYLFLHNERLAETRSLAGSFVANLGYWLILDQPARQAFAQAAARARRPDAAAFVALAQGLAWIDRLYHDPLRLPDAALTEPYDEIEGTGLFVPRRLHSELARLAEAAERAQAAALHRPTRYVRRAREASLESLCNWLQQSHARLIVEADDGRILWDPDSPEPRALRLALRDAEEAAVQSLCADFAVIDERTRAFFAALRAPQELPTHDAVLERGGGVYVDLARRAIVYQLRQPAFDARREPAPPYHRLLLGARVMHEWGHVAHAARFIGVPPERRHDYQAARERLGLTFARLLTELPAGWHAAVEAELATLAPTTAEVPAALARKTLARIGDYLANRLAAVLLPAEEMQTYVRANVTDHADEPLGIVAALARYAYEVHYLALASLPRDYFYATSRWARVFVDGGLVPRASLEALFDAVGAVLDCYRIDPAKIALPAA